jgi:LuxR family maltose regulon positive regulatory protein
LEQALALAEPHGHVRVFLDEGPRMVALLREASTRGVAADRSDALLAAAGRRTPVPVRSPLVEPLSDRELDVLRLLDSDLDGPAMARALFVSVNTLRTHTRNVYAKLGVTSRRAAVRRAEELGLR